MRDLDKIKNDEIKALRDHIDSLNAIIDVLTAKAEELDELDEDEEIIQEEIISGSEHKKSRR
jgi:hypothetical protein